MSLLHALGVVLLIVIAMPSNARSAPCADLMPRDKQSADLPRPVTADDLIKLRDIGQKWTFDAASPILAVSPDGGKVAFQLRRADPDTNTYCLGMVVANTDGEALPHLVDKGGDFIRISQDIEGLTAYPSGYTEVITPKWAPDGRGVAFRRRDAGFVQVWLAAADGTGSRAVTSAPFDIEDFAWLPDGKGLIVGGRPGLGASLKALEDEGRSGFLFDDRYIPFAGNRPFPKANIPHAYFRVDIATGKLSPASADEASTLTAGDIRIASQSAGTVAMSREGDLAWTDRKNAANVAAPTHIEVRLKTDRALSCQLEQCLRPQALWWTKTRRIVFQRREGWGRSITGLYEWNPQTGKVRDILHTDDVLIGCQYVDNTLICGHEASLQPREIVSIDLSSGRMKTVFDPNPEFKGITLGSVERVHWKNDLGIETFGDLVFPPGYRAGPKLPMVVVQYESRGFLRGGTDDDYPIQLFAANGFAVLSFETPQSPGDIKGGASWDDISRIDRIEWAERRSVLSALSVGVQRVVDQGIADPKRIGITGLSDGSSTVRFALLNSTLFSAAAVSSCCEDETSVMSLYGPGSVYGMHGLGYPLLTEEGGAFWKDYSLRLNAGRMRTPLLMQLADHEYLTSLESYTALREHKAPVEMYVFPDEYHEKWQPAHRRAVYARDIDWFAFWLMDRKDPASDKAEQYRRWTKLQTTADVSSASPGS